MTPELKAIIIRYSRVFIAAFLASLAIDQLLLTSDPDVMKSLLKAAVAAGISAVFKALREAFPEENRLKNLPL